MPETNKKETTDIQTLIDLFHEEAERLSGELGSVNGRLREGRAPTATQVIHLKESLGQIRERYEAVYAAAKKLSQEELKPDGTVDEYLKAAAIGIQKQKLEKLLELRSVLDQFLSIRSNKEKYEEMLVPLREEVYDLLDAMEKPRLEDVDRLFERVQGPKYFVEAVKEPLGSERLGELIEEELNTRYPADVLMGFFTRAYEFGEGPVPRALPAGGARKKARKAERKEAKKTPAPQPEPETARREPESRPPARWPAEPPKPKEPARISWSVMAPAVAVVEADKRIRTTPPNGSSFRSKLQKLDAEMIASPFLQILDLYGAVTARQVRALAALHGIFFGPDDLAEISAERALDAFVDRGWVARYTLDGSDEPIYGLTPFASASMRKETVQKAFRPEWSLRFSDSPRTYGAKESAARLLRDVEQNEALLAYLSDRSSEIGFDIYYHVLEEAAWNGDHYEVLVYARGSEAPRRYHLVTPEAEATVPAGEPVIIIGSPRVYGQHRIDGWPAPVLYLDTATDVTTLREAAAVFQEGEEVPAPAGPDRAVPAAAAAETSGVLIDSTLLSDAGPLDDSRLLPAIRRSLTRPAAEAAEAREAVIDSVVLAQAGALAEDVSEGKRLSKQLQLATNIRLDPLSYTGADLAEIFEKDADQEVLLYGAYAFALLAPDLESDYVLMSRGRQFVQDYTQHFASLEPMRGLLRLLLEVAEKTGRGFSAEAAVTLGGNTEEYLRTLRENAGNYELPITSNVQLKALAPIYKKLFGLGSAFQKSMKIIAGDARADRDEVARELGRYCTPGVGIDPAKIDEVLDGYWDQFSRNRNNRKLSYHARDQVIRLMRVRLELMRQWVEYVDAADVEPKEQEELRRLRDALRSEIHSLRSNAELNAHEDANLIRWILDRLDQRVQGPVDDSRLFTTFLLTGHVMLDEDGRPVIDDRFIGVRRYAPWTLVARHIEDRSGVRKDATFTEVREEIDGTLDLDEDGLLDNLQQLEMIGRLTDEPQSECIVTDDQVEEALIYAGAAFEGFEEKLELYHMLGQINEAEKTSLRDLALGSQEFFYGTRNLASWREFLDALSWEGRRHAQQWTELLMDQVEERRDTFGDSPLLAEAQERLERDVPNLTLAEEALNVFDMGLAPEAEEDSRRLETDSFAEFRTEIVYRTLYEECRRQGTGTSARPLKRFGPAFLERHHPQEWSADRLASATQLLQNWPASKGAPTTKHIVTVLQRLGFDISGAERVKTQNNAELYHVRTRPVPADGGPYAHPIAAFGTHLPEQLDVIAIYGPCTGEEVFAAIGRFKTENMPVVLLDYQLDQGQRRVISELFRTHSDQQGFLLVDRVLAMFLSMAPPEDRQRVLLECALPYAGLQPFGEAEPPDELFFGRREETEALLDRGGAAVLYGGRRTGKTALLRHVARCGSRPEEQSYFVYADAAGQKTEEDLARTLAAALNAQIPDAVPTSSSLAELAGALETLLGSNDDLRLTLLVDDMDEFLAAAAADRCAALSPLAELRIRRPDNFKLVLAGAAQTARAYRSSEADDPLPRLGDSLRLGQMRRQAAEDLLMAPLEYLGFRAGENGEVETMIANTNYYPGLIRELGRTLVQTLAEHTNKFYSAATGNPPYPLRSAELSAVLHSQALHDSIRDTVQLSLNLDRRYEAVARCVAWLCLSDGSQVRRSYTAEEIAAVAIAYETPVLQKETIDTFTVLLEEMADMGLLLKTRDGRYRLRRDAFLGVVGRDQAVLEKQLAEVTA